MGTQSDDPRGQNFDPNRNADEILREVTVEAPFLLSKYEMTVGQWQRSPAAERNPSTYPPGATYPAHRGSVSLLNPVESVSWTTCTEVLRRIGLRLPEEER